MFGREIKIGVWAAVALLLCTATSFGVVNSFSTTFSSQPIPGNSDAGASMSFSNKGSANMQMTHSYTGFLYAQPSGVSGNAFQGLNLGGGSYKKITMIPIGANLLWTASPMAMDRPAISITNQHNLDAYPYEFSAVDGFIREATYVRTLGPDNASDETKYIAGMYGQITDSTHMYAHFLFLDGSYAGYSEYTASSAFSGGTTVFTRSFSSGTVPSTTKLTVVTTRTQAYAFDSYPTSKPWILYSRASLGSIFADNTNNYWAAAMRVANGYSNHTHVDWVATAGGSGNGRTLTISTISMTNPLSQSSYATLTIDTVDGVQGFATGTLTKNATNTKVLCAGDPAVYTLSCVAQNWSNKARGVTWVMQTPGTKPPVLIQTPANTDHFKTTSTTNTYVLYNFSRNPITISSVTGLPAGFTRSSNCNSMAALSSCNFTVTSSNTVAQLGTATLVITFANVNSSRTHNLSFNYALGLSSLAFDNSLSGEKGNVISLAVTGSFSNATTAAMTSYVTYSTTNDAIAVPSGTNLNLVEVGSADITANFGYGLQTVTATSTVTGITYVASLYNLTGLNEYTTGMMNDIIGGMSDSQLDSIYGAGNWGPIAQKVVIADNFICAKYNRAVMGGADMGANGAQWAGAFTFKDSGGTPWASPPSVTSVQAHFSDLGVCIIFNSTFDMGSQFTVDVATGWMGIGGLHIAVNMAENNFVPIRQTYDEWIANTTSWNGW